MSDRSAMHQLRWEAHWMAERLVALVDQGGALTDGQRGALARAAEGVPAPASTTPLERLRAGSAGPAARLIDRLQLRPVDVDLLVLAGMSEQHEVLSALLSQVHPAGAPWTTVGLAARLLCRTAEERLVLGQRVLQGPLTEHGVLTLSADAPLFERTLRLPEALWWALGGVDAWPAHVRRLPVGVETAGLEDWLAGPAATRARRVLEADEPTTVVVTADSGRTALLRAAALVVEAGRAFHAFDASGALERSLEQVLGLHCLARGAVPVLLFEPREAVATAVVASFDGFAGTTVWAFKRGQARVEGARPALEVDGARLDNRGRTRMWSSVLSELSAHAPALATRYSLEPADAKQVAADARTSARAAGRAPELSDVAEAVRTRAGVTLASGVELVRPRAGWRDLVLPQDRLSQLQEAVGRLQEQVQVLDTWGFLAGRPGARGVRMLLTGQPGTGKTLSAEVLARELGVDLLLVDISRVVSKWIGETEKNLARVFDVADSSQAVLLFDEADALFGKRTEVSDAHDRYANLETAFLLSRLERFEGLAILSTNLRENIDAAFMRRLEFIVDYSEPEVEERLQIWRRHVPASAPLGDDVDFRELAELYPVVGGHIRNAAVAAAFVAAQDGRVIHQQHFLRAIRREYEKSGRAFPGMPRGRDVSGRSRGNHAEHAF